MKCTNSLYKIVQNLDFVSPEVKLRTYGQPRFKTIFGGIISIIMIISVIVLTVYFLKIMFNRELIWVTYSEKITINPVINLSSSFFFFTILDCTGNILEKSEEYINIQISIIDGDHGWKNKTVIPNKKCEFDDKYYCMDWNNSILLTSESDIKYSKLSIQINKCQNDSNVLKICKSDEIIENVFQESYILLKYENYIIDNLNYTSAGQKVIQTDILAISTKILKKFTYFIKKILHSTDIGYILFDHIDELYHTLDDYKESIIYKNNSYNKEIAKIDFSLTNKLNYYRRLYFKFQDVLANIGGIIESAVFFCLIIENYFTQKVIYCSLGNDMISFENFTMKKIPNGINGSSVNLLPGNGRRRKSRSFYIKDEDVESNNVDFKLNNFININESKDLEIVKEEIIVGKPESLNRNSNNVSGIYENKLENTGFK